MAEMVTIIWNSRKISQIGNLRQIFLKFILIENENVIILRPSSRQFSVLYQRTFIVNILITEFLLFLWSGCLAWKFTQVIVFFSSEHKRGTSLSKLDLNWKCFIFWSLNWNESKWFPIVKCSFETNCTHEIVISNQYCFANRIHKININLLHPINYST